PPAALRTHSPPARRPPPSTRVPFERHTYHPPLSCEARGDLAAAPHPRIRDPLRAIAPRQGRRTERKWLASHKIRRSAGTPLSRRTGDSGSVRRRRSRPKMVSEPPG